MISLYGLKNCDTCRKALKMLQAAGFRVTFVDVRAQRISADRRDAFFQAFGATLVNKRSTTWRGLSQRDREKPVVELLLAHPSLMKRPVIDQNGVLTLGWTKDIQTQYAS